MTTLQKTQHKDLGSFFYFGNSYLASQQVYAIYGLWGLIEHKLKKCPDSSSSWQASMLL